MINPIKIFLGKLKRAAVDGLGHPAPVPAKPRVTAVAPESPDELDPKLIQGLLPGELEDVVRHRSREELAARFGSDKWLHNYVLSIWEKSRGETRLTAKPWHLTLSVASICNAHCQFCNIPLRRTLHPWLELDGSVPHLVDLVSYARIFLLTGGEPTIHPRFGQMVRRLKDILDPRAYANMITHGAQLYRFKAELSEVKLNLSISLNAATAATHHALMGLGEKAFDRIIESVRWARSQGQIVDLSMVVVRQNLPEIPDFLRLADELGIHAVYLRSLIPANYSLTFPDPENFKAYPAWSHPEVAYWQDRAREAIGKVNVKVYGDPDQWSVPLHTAAVPPGVDRTGWLASAIKEPAFVRTKGDPLPEGSTRDNWRRPATNPYGRTAPFACSYPWHAVKLIDQSLRVDACGFLQHVKGHDDIGLHGADDFAQLWNSPALTHLRQTLQDGPLLPECLTCPYQLNGEWQARASSDRRAESAAT
jgi:pyruvate-formate lyase-activating enzyme